MYKNKGHKNMHFYFLIYVFLASQIIEPKYLHFLSICNIQCGEFLYVFMVIKKA